jgi:cytochrome c-type biogenesis protein CcmH/NrfG
MGARLRLGLRSQRRTSAALAVMVIALAAAWAAWQPLRSVDAGNSALADVESKRMDTARADAHTAHDRNPLSIQPYLELAAVEQSAGRRAVAEAALKNAVSLQPSNPEPWLALATYQLRTQHRPKVARKTLGAVFYLDPRSSEGISLLLEATRAIQAPAGG